MNKSHAATRSTARARSSAAEARMRRTLLDLDESDEIEFRDGDDYAVASREMTAILDVDEDDEAETGDINLLLHGYR